MGGLLVYAAWMAESHSAPRAGAGVLGLAVALLACQVTFYLKSLAGEFHSYYNAERFLVDDPQLRRARLALVVATGQVLRNGLAVLGIGAPDEMR